MVFVELDIKEIEKVKNNGIVYNEASKFPSIDVDLTFISDKYTPIKEEIANLNSELIKNTEVTDVYSSPEGKAITVRLSFVHPERTLTKEEVMEIADKLISSLAEKNIALKQ